MKVGISILTNGKRLGYLQTCINSFLENCHYRPLVISIFDNYSTDDTKDWLKKLPDVYGVEWRVHSAHHDFGCADGTNRSIEMVNDCKYILHLESDFEHLPMDTSHEDKMWLHRVVSFMEKGECDYMYLRRMVGERDIFMHWWAQWMTKIDKAEGRYLRCPGFWWSNNPTIFRHEALLLARTLPLDRLKDGKKGTSGWSRPELEAPKPPKAWIHKWGLFVHELPNIGRAIPNDCKVDGQFGCKYGFIRLDRAFCTLCKKDTDYRDMANHANRFSSIFVPKKS